MGKRKFENNDSIFKKLKQYHLNKNGVIVVEIYSYFIDKTKDITNYDNEIIANSDIGSSLRNLYNQQEYFIYALDPGMEDDIKRKLREQNKNLVVYNLANEEIIPKFKALLGKFDTFLIVAQGNLNEEKIAGLKAKNVIALLKEDLDLENQIIPNLELFCCCMGQAEKFREKLKNGLMGVVSNIITYTTLLSAFSRLV